MPIFKDGKPAEKKDNKKPIRKVDPILDKYDNEGILGAKPGLVKGKGGEEITVERAKELFAKEKEEKIATQKAEEKAETEAQLNELTRMKLVFVFKSVEGDLAEKHEKMQFAVNGISWLSGAAVVTGTAGGFLNASEAVLRVPILFLVDCGLYIASGFCAICAVALLKKLGFPIFKKRKMEAAMRVVKSMKEGAVVDTKDIAKTRGLDEMVEVLNKLEKADVKGAAEARALYEYEMTEDEDDAQP